MVTNPAQDRANFIESSSVSHSHSDMLFLFITLYMALVYSIEPFLVNRRATTFVGSVAELAQFLSTICAHAQWDDDRCRPR